MSGFSTYLDNKVIDHLFKGTSYATPTKYLALFKSATGLDTNTSWSANELTSAAGAYARVALPNTLWTSAASGVTKNNAEVAFAVATTHWGEVTHVGIMDAATGGNCIAWGALANPVTGAEEGRDVETGDQIIIRTNALTVKLV